MNCSPLVPAAMLSALALIAAGCHKETTRAYRPPPPPAVQSASHTRGRSGRSSQPDPEAADQTASTASSRTPARVPDSYGKPVTTQIGLASWYGPPYAGRKGADGKVYDQNAMTAAHLTLPLGTMVRVTNLANNESVVVRITDRGPFVHGRVIDLSLAAAKATGVYRAGVAKVKVEAYAAPVRSNADPAGRWCVQVGAFSRQSDAVKLKEELRRRYTTAKVIEFAGPTGHWVRINPQLPDKAHATQVADGIHPKDPDAQPYLIRTD